MMKILHKIIVAENCFRKKIYKKMEYAYLVENRHTCLRERLTDKIFKIRQKDSRGLECKSFQHKLAR